MALMYPLLGLAVLLALAGAAALAWWSSTRERPAGALLVDGTDRIRSLPRFRELSRRHRRWALVETLALAVAGAGVALLAARPVDASSLADERSNRDVVLCLDVSGSMAPVVSDVMAAFADLAADLDGERIALVWFDSTAVTMFPLTDDAGYIATQLDGLRSELDGTPVAGTQVGEVGSSLVGDGLASCLQRFDHLDASRSRTVVLATDNQVSGRPLFTLADAVARAAEDEVLVYGITPSDNTVAATNELEDDVATTGGDVLLLGPRTPLQEITGAVEATQSAALPGPPRSDPEDILWPGALLVCVGTVGAGLARRRRAA